MKRSGRLAIILGMIATVASLSTSLADTVKMKSGEEFSGKIVMEAKDFIKIELESAASSTIKESKMISRSDIKEILKTAPDDLEWEKIQKMVPTRSLLTASTYKTMIETGPKAFISKYPLSVHKTKVSEILTVLNEELDKVERGYQKIEDEWFSPEDRANYPMMVDAKKRSLAMNNQAAQRTLPAYIQAMRTFQDLEENHFGTPGHAKGLARAKELLPLIGQTATRFLRDAAARNQQFEEQKALLPEDEKMRVVAARQREEEQYAKSVAADQAAGIKWLRVNINSADSLNQLISLTKEEIARLDTQSAGTLEARAENLVEIDKMLAEDKLVDAKLALSKVEPLEGDGKMSSSKKKKSSSKKSTTKEAPKATSYLVELNQKLTAKFDAIALKEAAAAAAAEATGFAKGMVKKDGEEVPEGTEEGVAAKGDEEKTEGEDADAAAPAKRRNALAGIAETQEVSETADEPEDAPKKKTSTKKKKGGTDWDAVRAKKEASGGGGGGGGGLPSWAIPAIIGVVLGVTVLILKKLGIGGAKE